MDAIQAVLIKAGRKDLAKEYYKKFAGRQGYSVHITHKGKLEDKDNALFTGDQQDCESFIRTFPIKEKNKLLKQDKSLAIVTPDGRMI